MSLHGLLQGLLYLFTLLFYMQTFLAQILDWPYSDVILFWC
jgi:hypothetical protein